MTHDNDASRESSGAAVERSRSYPDAPQALTPPSVSLPLDLQAWERLARYYLAARESLKVDGSLEALRAARDARLVLIAFSTPERILGLIAAASAFPELRDGLPHMLYCPCHPKHLRVCNCQALEASERAARAPSPESSDHA